MKNYRIFIILFVLSLLILYGCGKNSGLEGKLVDGQGKPLANVKVIAKQAQPIKGYEHFETITKSDGTFTFKKLYPISNYILLPWHKDWKTDTKLEIQTGPENETIHLQKLLVVKLAFNGQGSVVNPQTGKPRFKTDNKGIITDTIIGLKWYLSPNRDGNWREARAWSNNLTIGGISWRMPSIAELRSIYKTGTGKCKIDLLFKVGDKCDVWSSERRGVNGCEFDFQKDKVWCYTGRASKAWAFAVYSELIEASFNEEIERVKRLVLKGVDINAKDNNGQTALMFASEKGNLAIVEYLISKGADINVKDYHGRTALIYSVFDNKLPVLKYLISSGADINVTDNYNNTALLYIKANDLALEIVKYLISNGANVNTIGNMGQTALMSAAENGDLAIVEYLISKGADVNIKDSNGWTALSYADNKEIISLLKTAGGKGKIISKAEKGKKLLTDKGCISCHSTDGSDNFGPTLKGIFQRIGKDAIVSKISTGGGGMPEYSGMPKNQLQNILDYLKKL